MRTIKLAATYLIILSVFSCSADKKEALLEEEPLVKTIEVTEFPETIDLRTNLDSVRISSPIFKIRNMISTKDHLVFMNWEEPLFSVYDNQTGEYRGAFGFKGEGPLDLEFNGANASTFKGFRDDFVVVDRTRMRAISVNSTNSNSLLNENNITIVNSKSLPKDLGFNNNAFLADDHVLFTPVDYTQKHFVSVDLISGAQKDTIDYPNFYPEIPYTAYHHLYSSHTAPSLNKGKFVIAYQRFPVLRVYDLKKGSYTQINVKPKNEQKKDIQADARGRSIQGIGLFTYYEKVVISEKYIYAKYQEGSYEKDMNGEYKSLNHTGIEIHIFDWDGKPVKKLLLPDWVNPYTITQNDEFIYFFHPENENYLYRKSMKD